MLFFFFFLYFILLDYFLFFFFFQAEDGILDLTVTGVQTCALPIFLVERGSFRPPTHVNLDMLATAKEKFAQDSAVEGKEILQLTEITMRNLLAERTDVDRREFLARAELLAACGETVLITDYFDYYRLAV